MKHKYLKETGILKGYWNNWGRFRLFDKIKDNYHIRKYGFSRKECYSLDNTFFLWFYEHLIQFKKDSKIIDWEQSSHLTYRDRDYTVIDLIDLMLDRLEFILEIKEYKEDPGRYELTEDGKTYTKEAFHQMEIHSSEVQKAKEDLLDMFKISINSLWW